MDSKRTKLILAGLATMALSAPSAFADPVDNPGNADKPADKPAKPEKPAKPAKPDKAVSYVFHGTYAGDGSVAVTSGNNHVDKAGLTGTTVVFDLTNAKLNVKDDNGDGVADINDVAVGDEILVTSRLNRKDPGTGPYGAKKLIDKTHPEVAP